LQETVERLFAGPVTHASIPLPTALFFEAVLEDLDLLFFLGTVRGTIIFVLTLTTDLVST